MLERRSSMRFWQPSRGGGSGIAADPTRCQRCAQALSVDGAPMARQALMRVTRLDTAATSVEEERKRRGMTLTGPSMGKNLKWCGVRVSV